MLTGVRLAVGTAWLLIMAAEMPTGRWRGHWFLGLGRTEQPERQKHHHRERKAVIDFLYTRQVHVEKLTA